MDSTSGLQLFAEDNHSTWTVAHCTQSLTLGVDGRHSHSPSLAKNSHLPWWQPPTQNSDLLRTACCPEQPLALDSHSLRIGTATCLRQPGTRPEYCLGLTFAQNGHLLWTAIRSKWPLFCLGQRFAENSCLPWTATHQEQPLAVDTRSLRTATRLGQQLSQNNPLPWTAIHSEQLLALGSRSLRLALALDCHSLRLATSVPWTAIRGSEQPLASDCLRLTATCLRQPPDVDSSSLKMATPLGQPFAQNGYIL